MRRVCLLILSFFLLSQCNPISDKELRFYWYSYWNLAGGVHDIEMNNHRNSMILELLVNPLEYYRNNYNIPLNPALLDKSKTLEIKIEESLNELEGIKRQIVPKYDKFTFDLGNEVQLDEQNQKLLLTVMQKGKNIFSGALSDTLNNFSWKTDYSEIFKHPIKKVFVLMAIENVKLELLIHQQKILDHYLKKAEFPSFELHYRIDMESKTFKIGDTLKASIYPFIYHKLKEAVINGQHISGDSNGIGNFVVSKSSVKLGNSGMADGPFNGTYTFSLGQNDTTIFCHPWTYIRKTK